MNKIADKPVLVNTTSLTVQSKNTEFIILSRSKRHTLTDKSVLNFAQQIKKSFKIFY